MLNLRRLAHFQLPDIGEDWAVSHAALPFAVPLHSGRIRVFFSTRDKQNKSSVAWFDLGLDRDRATILETAKRPVLTPGTVGMFDEDGVGLGSIVRCGDLDRMYYMGWSLGRSVPWRNSIGLALGSTLTAEFRRYSVGPILDRSPADPFTISYPWVMRFGAADWRMWYGSHRSWDRADGNMDHVINYAVSTDGIDWRPAKQNLLPFAGVDEYAQARPSVVFWRDQWLMAYAWRGKAYGLGCAVSDDGLNWRRSDVHFLDAAVADWEAEMRCYPCLFEFNDQLLMLYNGNSYGATGIGLAACDVR